MGATSPQELVSLFNKTINAGDLESLLTLYEPEAVFVLPKDQGGEARGREAIGQAMAQFLALKPTVGISTTTILEAAGVGLVIGDWTLDGTGPDGEPVHMEGRFRDVVRHQTDGTWLWAIDNPFGAD